MTTPSTPKRVALYARVSTNDKEQDPETQLAPLRRYAAFRGFSVANEYIDHKSGREDTRESLQELLRATRRGQYDIILVYRYDRFARSVQTLLSALSEFDALGVDFISYHEQIDTTTPQGKFFFTVIAGFAEFQSAIIADNVRDGMARAKREGKHVGRPRVSSVTRRKIKDLADRGLGARRIARELGVALSTAQKYSSEPSS